MVDHIRQEFKQFTKDRKFTHIMCSPTYAYRNGMAKRHILVIKIKKSLEDKQNIYSALFNYKNSYVDSNNTSSWLSVSKNITSNVIYEDIYFTPKILLNLEQKFEITQFTQ